MQIVRIIMIRISESACINIYSASRTKVGKWLYNLRTSVEVSHSIVTSRPFERARKRNDDAGEEKKDSFRRNWNDS